MLEGEEVFSSELRRQGDVGGGRCVPTRGTLASGHALLRKMLNSAGELA